MSRKVILIGILWVAFVAWSALGWLATGSVARPEYHIVEHTDRYEIRQYAAYLGAQVQLLGPHDQARREGFHMLSGYISDENVLQTAIAMSRVISVGIPVVEESRDDLWSFSFIMPDIYTDQTIPRPTNPRVRLVNVPEQTVAVADVPGWADWSRIRTAQDQLRDQLAQDGRSVAGPFRVIQYSPSWAPAFVRSAELLVPVR